VNSNHHYLSCCERVLCSLYMLANGF
jgi:hypothetical protein